MKKLSAILVAVVMILAMVAIPVAAEEVIPTTMHMKFPDDVPNGTKVIVGHSYADGVNEWSNGGFVEETFGPGFFNARYTFIKGQVEELVYPDLFYLGDVNWCFDGTNGNYWSVVNDEDDYKEGAIEIVSYDPSTRDVYLSVKEEDCIVPLLPTIVVEFPDDVPNGTSVIVANAYADGVDEWSNGGFCEGTGLEDFWQLRLKFVKGQIESLPYPDLYRVGDVDWYFNKSKNWAVVNDEEDYKQGVLDLVSFDPETRVMTLSVKEEDCVVPLLPTIVVEFPDDVPNGSTVTVANAYADGVDEWSNGGFCEGTGLEDFWQLRLKFIKGEVESLSYPDLYRVGNVDWYFNKGNNWSVVNDEENYKQGVLTFVSFDPETRVMTLAVKAEDCVIPAPETGTAHITVIFPDDVPNGATCALANAFADGKQNPEWGSGDAAWTHCSGEILTFIKGEAETLDYIGLPGNVDGTSEWIFADNNMAVVNDPDGYAATAWDDVAIADYLGTGKIQKVSFEYLGNAEINVTIKLTKAACVYEEEPETDAPETEAPETSAPETQGENPVSPVTADIAIVAAGLALAASAVVIFKKKH